MPDGPRPPYPERVRLHAFFSGRVQGVGMRMTVAELAQAFRLAGWVRNLPDRRVELCAEGLREDLDALLKSLDDALPGYVRHVEPRWEEATGEWRDFRITY